MNKTFKIIFLAAYTVLIFALAVLIINANKSTDRFKDYQSKPEDEYVSLNLQVIEARKSKEQTNTEYEKSNYDMSLFVIKKQVSKITNLYSYIAIETQDDKYGYTQSTSPKTMDHGTYTNQTMTFLNSSTSFSFKSITNEDGKLNINDKTPDKVYVKLSYDIEIGEIDKHVELNYVCNINKLVTKDFDNAETREVAVGVVDPKSDYVTLKMTKSLTKPENGVNTTNFKITSVSVNTKNLPEGAKIESFRMNVYALVKNESMVNEKYFSKYINIFSYYGALDARRAISATKTCSLDTNYEIDEIFVNMEVKLDNGNTQNVTYKVNVNQL